MTDIGDLIRFGNAAIDPSTGQALANPPLAFTIGGTATDPTAVTLTVVKPDKTRLVYGWPLAGADGSLVRESVGRFYADVTITQAGTWRYRIAGTGAVTSAAENSLSVQRSRIV